MDIYCDLGVVPVINAAGDLTKLGGRLMSERVTSRMAEASCRAVVIDELQKAAGERIAQITHSEAAYVVPGAAAGLALAVASSLVSRDEILASSIPRLPLGLADEVLVYRSHVTRYVRILELTGAKVRIVEGLEEARTVLRSGLVTAFYFLHSGSHVPIPFAETLKLAHEFDVPVIVDAAVALPPVENLFRYSEERADLVVFSGGKALGGPQASGFLCGRADLVGIVAQLHLGPPSFAVGRPMKVGKEEIVGLLEALEEYLCRPHQKELLFWRSSMEKICRELKDLLGIRVFLEESLPNGRPIPSVVLEFEEPLRAVVLADLLLRSTPRIALDESSQDDGLLRIYPTNLVSNEVEAIIEKIGQLWLELDLTGGSDLDAS